MSDPGHLLDDLRCQLLDIGASPHAQNEDEMRTWRCSGPGCGRVIDPNEASLVVERGQRIPFADDVAWVAGREHRLCSDLCWGGFVEACRDEVAAD